MEHDGDVIGFCCYCKDDIYEGEDYVTHEDNKYHVECYELIKEELTEEEFDD